MKETEIGKWREGKGIRRRKEGLIHDRRETIGRKGK